METADEQCPEIDLEATEQSQTAHTGCNQRDGITAADTAGLSQGHENNMLCGGGDASPAAQGRDSSCVVALSDDPQACEQLASSDLSHAREGRRTVTSHEEHGGAKTGANKQQNFEDDVDRLCCSSGELACEGDSQALVDTEALTCISVVTESEERHTGNEGMDRAISEKDGCYQPEGVHHHDGCEQLDVENTPIDTEVHSMVYNVSKPPVEITGAWSEFPQTENYFKGCKWSPDGSCLLTCNNDCALRLFNLPEPLLIGSTENLEEMLSVLKIQESETVYDYCWYPPMTSADPLTCCFATTAANTPVHLWDAFSGALRCSYRAYNQVDEVTPAHCVMFSPDGSKLYCGFDRMVRVFEVERPGRQCEQRRTYCKEGQAGIISCIATSPLDTKLYAAGSYSRSVALYYEPKGDMACMFQGHQGGVTHIQFSPDGTKLLSGSRKDPEILCWDLRNPGHILFSAKRKVETNQRIYFDIDNCGRYLVSGNQDGTVSVWDMTQPTTTRPQMEEPVLEPVLKYQAHSDTVNGVSLHPSMPLLLTSSGQRHFPNMEDSDEEDTTGTNRIDNSVRLWYI